MFHQEDRNIVFGQTANDPQTLEISTQNDRADFFAWSHF
jgi:hypothetical protein